MKAFAVIGYHHSGKTTVVTSLVKALTEKGYKVATIKDIHNEDYRVDTEGKNTWQHIQAGAVMTFARGLHDSALIFPQPLSLKEMTALIQCDYLIIEGMKSAPVPKILCAESAEQLEELYDDTVFAVSGKLANGKTEWQEPPLLDVATDLDKLTDLVEKKVFDLLPDSDPDCCSACGLNCYEMVKAILKGERLRTDCKTDSAQQVSLAIDGKPVVIVPFVQNLLKDVLLGFISNLKDINPQGNIKIEITQHDRQDSSPL
ncbi:MAG: molybdopterin-guanine dinucleotide biosynthesis protein B [Candidatus Cloacimonadaceae bacterium]